MKFGFSTGGFHKIMTARQAVHFLDQHDEKIIELGFVHYDRVRDDQLGEITALDLESFSYVSFHAPKITYGDNDETKEIFTEIDRIHTKRKLDLVVVHPDTVEDFSVFKNVSWPVGFENMDNRKDTFKHGDEFKKLKDIFPNLKMILDINHIYTNDETMELLKTFEEYNDNIVQIHLSGFSALHDPLFQTKQSFLIDAIKQYAVPVIIESTFNDISDYDNEKKYIMRNCG